MRDNRPSEGSRTADRVATPSRRQVVAGVGAGLAAALAGCSGSGSSPNYERRTVDGVQGDARNASEMSTAEAVSQTAIDGSLSTLAAIDVTDHEFVLEDGYQGSTVQGTLVNDGDERLRSVEVRVRVYDDQGRHLGRYVAGTGDLAAGTAWPFTVVLLVPPGDVAAYDLAALGMTA
jgi:hypothetical protein